MEYTLTFDPQGRYATALAWGPTSMKDMRALSTDLTTHHSWRVGMALVFDMRELETADLSKEEIRAMAESTIDFNEAMGSGKGAIVVSDDLSFGLARMWSAYNEDMLSSRNRIFRSMDEAMKWILEP